jgi:hypothetical protein
VRRTIFAAVPLAVLALAAPAAAKGGHATTYKAKVQAVAAAAPATAAKHGAKARATGVRGQAKLVDGRRDKVQFQVKGLEAGATYTWSVRSASGSDDACAGDAVDAFEYNDLTARRRGNSKARARSRTFAAEDGTSYAVVITDADGNDVACGAFLSKADRKAKRQAERKAKGKHAGDQQGDDSQGEDEQGDDSQGDDQSTEPETGDDNGARDGAEDPSGDDEPEVED